MSRHKEKAQAGRIGAGGRRVQPFRRLIPTPSGPWSPRRMPALSVPTRTAGSVISGKRA